MTTPFDPERDLRIGRVIRASRAAVWHAWTDPASFERWWVPEPARCRVAALEVRPGGAFATLISEDGGPFVPHVTGCFLAAEPLERIVFTDALTGGCRPGPQGFVTAAITLCDHPEGTNYAAHVMHRSPDDRATHERLGFMDGWGTVIGQLARLVER